jgi:hypothetical protein
MVVREAARKTGLLKPEPKSHPPGR